MTARTNTTHTHAPGSFGSVVALLDDARWRLQVIEQDCYELKMTRIPSSFLYRSHQPKTRHLLFVPAVRSLAALH
jgi:hypothetical protein